MPNISIVTPVYKAETCIEELYEQLVFELEKITTDFEIIMVEDCGGDASWAIIERLAKSDNRLKGIKLSRNFGQHYAISAGLDVCDGDWVVVMDCDLQDRPKEIPRLYAKTQEGFDIVCARRGRRKDSFGKKISSIAFVRVFNSLADLDHDPQVANFRIISRKVVVANKQMREVTRNFPAQLHWLGFKVGYLDVQHGKRHSGKSSYSLAKLLLLAVNSITAYSNKPLRFSMAIGSILALLAFLSASYFLFHKLFFGVAIDGWTSLMVSIWFLGGAIIANLGVIGIYLGRTYDEAKGRPHYIIDKSVNLTIK